MFTGIIEHVGRIVRIDTTPFGARLRVDAANLVDRVTRGDSVAVHGVCLTIADESASNGQLRFDVVSQTLRLSALGDLNEGDRVHLEPAATPTTMLGGHVVQGHVDAIGSVIDVRDEAADRRVRIRPDQRRVSGDDNVRAMDCIVAQGSIAINGVSLTVADTGEDDFEIALIPTTLELTTLGELQPGDRVNLETDYMARIVVNWLRRHRSPDSEST